MGFEEQRPHLRAVAYRMLGSMSEADDAVQETWLRYHRTDSAEIDNLAGWLTTVVARVCLNMLRSRETRREEPLDEPARELAPAEAADPEQEAMLAESVGLALLVVLDTLTPAERIAFVLHDMFAMPFDDIGPMIERTAAATRQLASRARRRVKGVTPIADPADLPRRRNAVDAYLSACRSGDFEALVALLDPNVVLRADPAVGPTPVSVMIRGGATVAKAALASMQRALFTETALVDGKVGLVMAPYGRLSVVLVFTFAGDLIADIDVIAEPDRLRNLEIACA
ncbi:sigma-70 family RNA polymerase sigma factor [Nocardia sp. BMG111209]|uniref:sigma-70 family RNA polymerase sigma factor n=1 Tax=Nocardia sp. BMG111209 TaxID=1160137 RepID=UPI000365E5ED